MEKINKQPVDFILLLLVVLLIGVGISILFSASYYQAERIGKNPQYFFIKQIIMILIGAAAAYVLSITPLELLRKLTPFVLLTAFILSLLVFVPGLGQSINGARRWIFIADFSFQPSEVVKVALIIYLASILSKKQNKINDLFNTILPPLLVITLFVVIIYLQNDLSTAWFLFFIALSMFFIARVKLMYFIFLASIALPLGAIMLFTKEHRVRRLIAFWNPSIDPAGTGFQALASTSALKSGGILGKGLGMGIKKLGVPEAQSDFIFAVAGEEMGFIGLLFIILLFFFFAFRGYLVALKCQNSFYYFLAFGITSSIFLQALLNMFVVAGLVPATGVPLPFFSSGGSSILMTLAMCGLLLNLSRQITPGKEKLYG